MSYSEMLKQLIEENNGILITKDAVAAGIPKVYLSEFVQEGITVFSVSRDIYDEGIVLLSTPFGRSVKANDMDRTMCDLVRSRNYMDIAILTDGFKQYVKRSDKNIPRLMKYAERFRMVKYVRSYLEVLL